MCEGGKTAGKENVPSECAENKKSRDLTPGTLLLLDNAVSCQLPNLGQLRTK